ncbi:MAG: hypothetical protein BMS9Abin14_294 [Gammaproteobacteria bacterium]|nr:MAG: hypothetical protein BMS9Abin14_294 [Gammaproteobacteria bacterium]
MRNKFVAWTAATLGIVAALAFAAGIVGSAMASDDSGKYDDSYRLEGSESGVSGSALPMEELVATLKQQGYGEIYEIEREDGVYEVKARGETGSTVKLYVDPESGQILRQKTDD